MGNLTKSTKRSIELHLGSGGMQCNSLVFVESEGKYTAIANFQDGSRITFETAKDWTSWLDKKYPRVGKVGFDVFGD